MLRVGFIGPGSMGSFHLKSLKALEKKENIVITDIADVRPERLEWAKGVCPDAHLWNDGDELLEHADVDVVWITAPSYLHAHFVVKALKKGCHVFCEKPLCLNKEDVDAILEAKKRSGKECMVGMVVRFMWQYRLLKELNESQKFGKLRSIVMQRISTNPYWGWEDWFNDEKKSGSVVLDLHIHDVDLLRYAFGDLKIEHISAKKYEDTGLINQIIATFKVGEATAVVEGVWHHCKKFPFIPSFRAEFDKATVNYNHSDERVYWSAWDGTDGYFEAPKQDYDKNNEDVDMNISNMGPYYIEDKYFLECLNKGLPNTEASVESAAESVLLCLEEFKRAKEYTK